jgi:hypothetical protein
LAAPQNPVRHPGSGISQTTNKNTMNVIEPNTNAGRTPERSGSTGGSGRGFGHAGDGGGGGSASFIGSLARI